MMDVKMEVTDPDEVKVTLTITAPLREWRRVHEACSAGKCGYPLQSAIWEAMHQVRKTALASTDEENGA